jgi:hypothetical protein
MFQLFIGARIPASIRESCFVHSSAHVIFLANLLDDALMHEIETHASALKIRLPQA